MKIYDEHQKLVGELERPGPVEQDGTWYEAVEYRIPKEDELYFYHDKLLVSFGAADKLWWIMRPIPRATAGQLNAIGMRERDDRPVEVHERDEYWETDGVHLNSTSTYTAPEKGKYRWVLEDMPAAKEPAQNEVCMGTGGKYEKEAAHTSCVFDCPVCKNKIKISLDKIEAI